MPISLRSLPFALVLAGLFATTQMACAVEDEDEPTEESAEAITNGRIVVKQLGSPGAQLTKWGYDVKQDGRSRALKPALAKEIFGDIGMNLLRVPVRAADAHPTRGLANVKKAAYADDLQAIANVKAVKPSADVFASLKLLGDKTFPGWVKNGGDVDAAKYAELLEDYLAFMKANGVTIDWLGIDNERRWNEGNITPAKYDAIASNVRAWCKSHDVKVPGFIAAEDYGPSEDLPWVEKLWSSPAQFDNVDHVGVHTYTKHRNAGYVDALGALANKTHGKGLWDSEFHWNDLEKDGDVRWDDLRPGILAAMDHFDQGFHALTWWAFQPRSAGNKASFIMSELVSSTVGASMLAIAGADDANGVHVRALKKSAHEVTLWIANYDNRDRKDLKTEIANQDVTAASFVQWSPTSAPAGKSGNAKVSGKAFSMTFPANTITRVSVSVK